MTVTPSAKREWLVPTALIMLSLVPVAAGTLRVAELSSGAGVTPENARFFASPVPVVVHVVSASLYGILGAFQFVPGLRRRSFAPGLGRRRLGWHRAAGRLLVPCGIAAALSGLWMTLFYPRPDDVGDLLTCFRLVFGSAMVLFIALGFAAVRRRDIARHRAWMMRGYAIGMGAGTQVVTQLPWILAVGALGTLSKALLMLAGWGTNLAVAEWIIRSRRAGTTRTSSAPSRTEPARTETR